MNHLIYLAGVFDAKGSVGIRTDKGYSYPFISIRSSNLGWLYSLRLLYPPFKGPVQLSRRSYGLFLYRLDDIYDFLVAIRDATVTTRPICDATIEFIESKRNNVSELRLLQLIEEIRRLSRNPHHSEVSLPLIYNIPKSVTG